MEQLSSQLESELKLKITLTELKLDGDANFMTQNYLGAYQNYSQILEEDQSNSDILRKRAFTLYNLGAYRKGRTDCDKIIHLNPTPSESVIILKVKCLWGLRKYVEALQFLEALSNPSSTIKEWITKGRNVLQNSKGQFDIHQLFKLPNASSSTFGEYQSDSFRIAKIPGKGRGLVASKKISAGQLLIVSKPWEIVFAGDKRIGPSDKPGQDWDEYRTLLKWKIFQKLQILDEDELRDFCELSVDARTRKEQGWLGDQCKIMEEKGAGSIGEGDTKEILNEIDYRILNNGFSRAGKFWGVFILPSLINHSCVDCNVFRHTFGDLMIIRAVKEINRGEELTIAYLHPTHPDRAEILKQHKIPCDCRLCLVQKSDLENPTLANNMEKLLQSITTNPPTSPQMKLEIVRKLTYFRMPPTQANLQLLDGRVGSLASQLFVEENWKEASDIFSLQRAVYKNFGMMREMVEVDLHLFKANLDSGDLRGAQGWLVDLKKDLILAYGIVSIVPLKKHPVVKDLEDCDISFLNLIEIPAMVNMLAAK